MKIFVTALLLLFSCTVPAQIIHTVVGIGGNIGYSGDGGSATAARISDPASVALDTAGNLYIADGDYCVIRKVDNAGIITTIAGTGWRGYGGDGGPATNALLNSPIGLSIDTKGNIYFADLGNNIVRVIDTSGIIKTFAGNRMAGYGGDGGPATAALLNEPYATACDGRGNLYVCDLSNDVIRKINTSGIITKVAGNGTHGYSGDGGPATTAELFGPTGVASDKIGNLFIADSRNNVIRKVDTFGIITTIAGNGTPGYAGDDGPATTAKLALPVSIGVNSQGLYIADFDNNVIRKIDTSFIISTVAGNGFSGYSGDEKQAIYAELKHPGGMAVDKYGDFYFGDVYNFVVRKVDTSQALTAVSFVDKPGKLLVYPSPATIELNIVSPMAITSIAITNSIGQMMYTAKGGNVLHASINVAHFPPGAYFINVNDYLVQFVKL